MLWSRGKRLEPLSASASAMNLTFMGTAAPGVWAWGLWRDGHYSSLRHEQSVFGVRDPVLAVPAL